METQQNYFIIFDTTEGAFLAYNSENNCLVTFRTEQEARDAVEVGYKKNYEQESLTWAASGAIHWLNLQPFVISLPVDLTPVEVITTLANCDIPDIKSYSLHSNAVTHTQGIKVDLDICRNYQVSKIKLVDAEEYSKALSEVMSETASEPS